MTIQKMTFAEFKEEITSERWWGAREYPTYLGIEENEYTEPIKVVRLNLVKRFPHCDGKVLKVQVSFNTEEEYRQIREYLTMVTNELIESLKRNLNNLPDFAALVEDD